MTILTQKKNLRYMTHFYLSIYFIEKDADFTY